MKRFVYHKTVTLSAPGTVCNFLAAETGLPKIRIKDAMNKGAVWLKGGSGGKKRIRRATHPLRSGDRLWIYYDSTLLSLSAPEGKCLEDRHRFTIWYKPPDLLTQGTAYGDHCSLMRQAETYFRGNRTVYLLHRLDREASGLVMFAHDKTAAAKLSHLFQTHQVEKTYRAELLGDLAGKALEAIIDLPLEGKPAKTVYRFLSYDGGKNTSLVEATTRTGRYHQVRRHFAMIGFPIMGDPKYGKENKNAAGLQLIAVAIRFQCPYTGHQLRFGDKGFFC